MSGHGPFLRRRGFMFPEAVAGLALLTMLTGMLALASVRHARVSQRNLAQLEVERLAQQNLLAAQRGSLLPPASTADSVSVETLPSDAHEVQWIAITVHHQGRSATLVGPMLDGKAP